MRRVWGGHERGGERKVWGRKERQECGRGGFQ